jgi:SWI/SNF-related matrix-associated actin-dependent regulator 1 of chromatin subfamily A
VAYASPKKVKWKARKLLRKLQKHPKLMPFQKEGVKQMIAFNGRVLLADEQGLGKTIQVLRYFQKRFIKPESRLLVVCPASLKFNWEKEALEKFGLHSIVLSGRQAKKEILFNMPRVVIVNYDILDAWLPILLKVGFRVMAFDESHYIKSRETRRYKTVRELVMKSQYIPTSMIPNAAVGELDTPRLQKRREAWFQKHPLPKLLFLSGTPLTNRPVELYSVVSMLLPHLFPSFSDYAFRYCRPRRTRWGWDYRGAQNLLQLHQILAANCMIRRLKVDVLKDLPEKRDEMIPLDVDLKEYNVVKNDFKNWMTANRGEAAAKRASAAEQVAKIAYLFRVLRDAKEKYVFDWIDNFLESCDRKLIVFSHWRKDMEVLTERYKDRCVEISGRVSNRKEAVDAFTNSKQVRILFGTEAAYEGLNLQAASDTCFLNLPWTPGKLAQAKDRSHRIGQKNACNYYYLLAHNTIDETLCKMLIEKQKVLNQVLDGDESKTRLDVLAKLTDTLLK